MIIVSNLNPLNLVDKARTLQPIYHQKNFDEWLSSEQLLPWQQAPDYKQKWQNTDILFLQFKSDILPIHVNLVDEYGVIFLQEIADVVTTIAGYSYSQVSMAFTDVPEGFYRIEVSAEGHPTLESECLHIAADHPNTLLYKYSHDRNDKDVIFSTGIYFMLRVEGSISQFTPTGSRVIYIDTPLDSSTVKGYSSRNFVLYLGCGEGVPNYFADKVQDIFDLRYVEIDGKAYTAAASDSKLTAVREDDVAFAGWTLDIAEAVNRRGKLFDGSGIVEKKYTLDIYVEGKLFGPIGSDSNDNSIMITQID